MKLQVKKPMILYRDNKSGVDIINSNWSIARNMQAISVWFTFSREMKEAGGQIIKWIPVKWPTTNGADLYRKKVSTMENTMDKLNKQTIIFKAIFKL